MKNINIKFAILLVSFIVVLIVASAVLFSCTTIAYATNEVDVVFATVSNLKGNEYAGISSLKMLTWGEAEPFYVPESYYIENPQPFGNQPGKYTVEYCGATFILEIENLTTQTVAFDNGVYANPDVRVFLKDDVHISLNGVSINNEFTIKLLGFNADGTKVYVCATLNDIGYYGFVNAEYLQPFNVPYHPISQAEREELLKEVPLPEINGGDIIPNTSLALRIVLIIGIAVPAVIIAVLLFKPTKNSKRVISNQRKTDFDYDEPQDRRQR